MIITGFISPGGPFIDNVDQTVFPDAIKALADNGSLTHVVTLLGILASLAVAYGLFSFFRLAGREGGFVHSLLRFGLVLNLFHYAIFILEGGMRHLLVLVADNGIGTGDHEQDAVMMSIHAAGVGLHFAFLTVSSVAGILLGVGLATRASSLNAFAGASWVLALAGLVGLVNVIVGEHIGGDIEAAAVISSIVLFVGAAALVVIGLGVLSGDDALTPEDS